MSNAVNPLPLIKDNLIMEAIARNPSCSWRVVPHDPNDPAQVEAAKFATAEILDAIINKTMGLT